MKPFSDLSAIIQDGFSFKCEMPNGWGMPGVQVVTISTHQIAELILTSGKLLAWDLFMTPDDDYFFKKSLTPGRYPVVISVANFHPSGEKRIACAMVLISKRQTVRWELAAVNNPDMESNEDIDHYGVDSGTGSFMDIDAAKILAPLVWEESSSDGQATSTSGFEGFVLNPAFGEVGIPLNDKFEEFCDKVRAEMEKNSIGNHGGASWADMKVSADTEANVVTFSAGWGDGGYASFWGYDALGNLTCLVTDFDLFSTPTFRSEGTAMRHDSSGDHFTLTELKKDDPTLKEYLELPEEEKQSSFVATLQLLPGSEALEIEDMDGQLAWSFSKLSAEDFAAIEALGLRGKLIASGCSCSGDKPFTSRTLIVAQDPIKEPVDLPQPNNCQVIYYQVGDEWRRSPADAPVLKKRIRLTPDPSNQNLFNMWEEAYFGSDAGGGGGLFNWKNWPRVG